MIKKELIAKCKLKDSLLLVIDGLTKNNYGIIFVYEEDKFIGIITDGDIRRSLNRLKDKFYIYKAKDIMTKKFLKVQSDKKYIKCKHIHWNFTKKIFIFEICLILLINLP